MISGQNISPRQNKLFSIKSQIYSKMNSKSKLNIPQNSKPKELNNNFITPTKLQKYTELYSKYKSHSKSSTKLNTKYSSKTKSAIKPSFSLCQLVNLNSNSRYPSLISNFNNSSFFPKTPNKKSRNIYNRFHKNSTCDKKINLDKLCPNMPSLNTQTLMRNTMKSLNFSYKKFFLNRKKIKLNITSTNKKKNNKNKKEKNNLKSNKVVKIKKYKIAINDEECLNNDKSNNNINDNMIKKILGLKLMQNNIQYGLSKKSEIFKKKSSNNDENIQEFSFNKDYIVDNYDENDNQKNCVNNDDLINLINKNEWCNLIQSNIITSLPEFGMNQRIYEENYECDTPQFTTLNEQK